MIVWLILKNRRADRAMRTYEICLSYCDRIKKDEVMSRRRNWLLAGDAVIIDKGILDLMRLYASLGALLRQGVLDRSLIQTILGKTLIAMKMDNLIRDNINTEQGLRHNEYDDLRFLFDSVSNTDGT